MIQKMNITSKDLNLLHLFKVLYEERNITQASKRVSLSQPALSHKLNKLRNEFKDDLFVRASRGLTPTPLAHQIAPQVLELLSNVESFYQQVDSFDFLKNDDVVRIYTTDLIEQMLLPKLLPIIEEQAPKLQIITFSTGGSLPKQELETGSCDIAIAGFYNDLPDTYFQQSLSSEKFVVLASKYNKSIKNNMDMDDYLSCPHVVTTLSGNLSGLVDEALAEKGLSRRVAAGMSSFLSPPMVIKQSNFILTCLSSIAEEACANYCDLKMYQPPLELDSIGIVQTWHQRSHHDPMRKWVRQTIHQILSTKKS